MTLNHKGANNIKKKRSDMRCWQNLIFKPGEIAISGIKKPSKKRILLGKKGSICVVGVMIDRSAKIRTSTSGEEGDPLWAKSARREALNNLLKSPSELLHHRNRKRTNVLSPRRIPIEDEQSAGKPGRRGDGRIAVISAG